MYPLQFGIPDIDALIIRRGRRAPNARGVTCIEGPVGSGKSTLALHAAAHYFEVGEDSNALPLVLFVSTDWRESDATTVWTAFGLGNRKRCSGKASHRTQWTPARTPAQLRPLAIGSIAMVH
jgi:hypothetical protein